MAPEGIERVGDVSNVLFSSGWIQDQDGTVFIYYASSDTRMHVAVSSVDKLVYYVMHTPEDTFTSAGSVNSIIDLVNKNSQILYKSDFRIKKPKNRINRRTPIYSQILDGAYRRSKESRFYRTNRLQKF